MPRRRKTTKVITTAMMAAYILKHGGADPRQMCSDAKASASYVRSVFLEVVR